MLFITAMVLGGASGARAADAPQSPVVAATSQVWLVNTRCAPRCGDLECGTAKITYCRTTSTCDCNSGSLGDWKPSDAASFAASGDPTVPTIIVVHGNGTDDAWAVEHGAVLNAHLKSIAGGRPYRLVIWSWLSDKEAVRPRVDVQIKVEYCEVESYYLARALATVPAGTPTSLIGYSLGARALGGAMELLGGGTFHGRCLAPEVLAAWKAGPGRPTRAMFLASAMDTDFLDRCGAAALAPASIERIFVSRNSCDRVLKFYSRIYGRGGPEALGYAGPTGPCDKLEVVDVSCQVGPSHDFDLYQSSPSFLGRLGWYTYLTGEAVAVK
jgi:hypothetical protein